MHLYCLRVLEYSRVFDPSTRVFTEMLTFDWASQGDFQSLSVRPVIDNFAHGAQRKKCDKYPFISHELHCMISYPLLIHM